MLGFLCCCPEPHCVEMVNRIWIGFVIEMSADP
jgi:hypothetical protein